MNATPKEELAPPLEANHRSRAMGAILVDAGRLTEKDVIEIQAFADSSGLLFGEAGIELKRITAGDVDFALARQFNYPVLPCGPDGVVSEEVVAAYLPQCDVVEDLRTVRSRLVLDWLNRGSRNVLAIISPSRGEGRSWFAANLATVFAQAGERTLLIDADMRNAQQHRFFRLSNTVGLSALLTGRAGKEAAQRVHPDLRLFVLPAGVPPPNPQELLTRPVLDVVIQRFASQFDVVILDTPPAQGFADAHILATRAGSALMLAKRNFTSELALQTVLKSLGHSSVKVVGSVFNNPV
jgi:chain length determinant protein tyrosine kinase EpsG